MGFRPELTGRLPLIKFCYKPPDVLLLQPIRPGVAPGGPENKGSKAEPE